MATVGWVILTAIIGFALLRYQRVMMMKQMQQAMQGGSMMSMNMFSGTFLMFASILLILPGFLTDFLGILFLIPKIRFWLLNLFMRLQSRGKSSKHCGTCKGSKTIEGEFWQDDK